MRRGQSLVPSLPLFMAEANNAVKVFNKLRLPDVIGKPPLSEACGEWFREVVAALFGSLDPETGIRMIGEIFLLTPKKQAKTTYGAALMLTALLLNERPRAEFLFIGPTKMIADLAFSQAVGMIEADPEGYLQKRMHVQEHMRQITNRQNRAKLVIKAFDSSVLTGIKPAGVLCDELHEISRDGSASRVIGQIRGGLLPNPEGFLIFITTQSDQPPAGAFKAELGMARDIRDGRTTGRMLPITYEFPEDIVSPASAMGEDPRWYDPSVWWMVTPNRDRSVTIPRLEEGFARARHVGKDEVGLWASQHLNIEIGLALRSDAWAGADFWQQQADKTLYSLQALIARSEVITIGLDGGGLDDLMAMAVLGRDAITREWLLWVKCWAHPIALSRHKSVAPRLMDFAHAGELVIVERIGEDLEEIAEICADIEASGKLAQIGADTQAIGGLVDALAGKSLTEENDKLVGITQGWKLTSAIKTCERKIAAREFWHAGQAIMAWMVGNARVEPRGNAILITKQASGQCKIDGVSAMLDAVSLMSQNPEAVGKPYYETHGILTLRL